MRAVRPFADAVGFYRRAGWAGTLPLPERAKSNPPDRLPDGRKFSFTGHDGVDPDDATVAYWAANGQATGNIALRMLDGVIGLDVDAYDAWRPVRDPATGQVVSRLVHKRGAETLAELEAALGLLPPTWVSSARPAPSGIRLFRVPDGVTITESALPGDIEIVRRGHRYMVAPPSVHPETGTAYGWWFGSSTAPWYAPGRPPSRDEIPWLPGAWAVRLSSRPAAVAVPAGEFWQAPKSVDTARAQWARLAERFVGFVRHCEWFGWGGDAHGQLLELTRETAQLAPAHAHRAIGEWFAAGGATFVDHRVWQMLESALGKYPADKIVAAPDALPVSSVAADLPPAYVAATATNGSHARLAPAVESTSQTAAPGGDGASVAASSTPPRRLPMIGDPVWDAYGWTRSVRAMARSADVCPDAVLGACLATYAARIPPGVRIVTGTKMPLGANLVTALVGPSGSDKSTAFNLAQRMMPGSAVPVINNPGSGEAFAASFVHPDPEADGAPGKRPKVLKPDPRALFYVAEGAMLGAIGARLGSTWLPHLRSLAVDESLSTTNATAEINRTVPAQRYRAGVVIGFQVTTAMPVLHDTSTGTAQRFLWFTSLSSEPRGLPAEAPHVPMETPAVTRLAAGIDDANEPIHYLAVTRSITERIIAEQEHTRLTRDITSADDHDAHRHTLIAKLAALAVLADGRVMIDEHDWLWAEALYAASAATRDVLLDIAEERARAEQLEHGQRMATADRARKQFDGDEVRAAQVILNRLAKTGSATKSELRRSLAARDRRLFPGALDQLEQGGWIRIGTDGRLYGGSRTTDQ
jgi:hypothetical protein